VCAVAVVSTLCLSPRLTRALSSIMYHKTKGNPLFVSRLMLSLSKDGLLRPSLGEGRWVWDKEKILCQKLPDDVAEFLTDSIIGKLSEDVTKILCVLSCFGASVDIAFVKTLETALGRSLFEGLDVAVAEGLLVKTDDKYSFTHGRIQEAAYNMIEFLDRCEHHFSYGMALAPLADGEGDDGILLTAVNQLNLAGPEAVEDESQNAIVANLNLRAGKKAMEMSDFGAAYSYFDRGISFLRKKHWEEHYALSLELFNLAAKCALTNGDILSLKLISQQVLRKSRSFEDKLNVMYLATCSLASSSQLPESVEKGLSILSKLGIDLRGCGSSMEACVQEMKDLLSAYTDDEILNTRRMTDPTMIMAMKVLGKLETGMTQIMPKSAPYVTQHIIQLSLDHGMSPCLQ
jgi:predicted ATPase